MNKILFKLIEGKGKFFLMRYFPPEPPQKHNWTFDPEIKVYNLRYQRCLEEALKNGEIVNPERLYNVSVIEGMYNEPQYFHIKNVELKDGDSFDFPNGLTFESFCSTCWCTETDEVKFDCCSDVGNQRIKLLEKPVQKEESQEDMWIDVFKLVDTNHTIEYLSELFTIKRKD